MSFTPIKISTEQGIGIGATLLLAAALIGATCFASYYIHSGDLIGAWHDIVMLAFGVACGWIAGTVFSPAASSELAWFVRIGTAIGSFLSGYVLSKADALITMLLTPAKWKTHSTLSFQVLVWLTGLTVAGMATFIIRSYLVSPTREEELELLIKEAQASEKIAAANLRTARAQKETAQIRATLQVPASS